MSLFKKPTVSSAVASLESAFHELELAVKHHEENANSLREQIAKLQAQESQETASASRAARIRTKLGDLLA